MKRTASGLLAVSVVLAACAGAAGPGATRSPGASGEGGGIERPSGAAPILTVRHEGGMLPFQLQVAELPTFVLLGDGRVIIHGMQTLEFPGPALPALIERTLTPAGVELVLDAVGGTGLFTTDLDTRGAQNFVADGLDTVFTLDAGGDVVVVRVYGLGTLDPVAGAPPGMASDEWEAYRTLSELNDALTMLETWLPADAWEAEGWQPVEPEAFRLYVRDVTGEPVEGGDLPEHVREWPTDDDPVAFGEAAAGFDDGTRCGVVEEDLAATWLAELQAANQMTLWTDDGDRRFMVRARPLLPGEAATCPEPPGS